MATNFMPAPDDEDADWPLPRWVEGDSLAPFQSCQPETVEAILRLAKVTKDDVLYDLGCGDGRVCIGASKQYGAKAVGSL
jgi:cyclopropane fatty-acyl-phospholipid synthase-like methyltransferase